jgi:hypothetical protein
MKSLLRMPARVSVLGPSASKPQVVTLPSAFFTSTSSHECGFVYWKSFTVPIDRDLFVLVEHHGRVVGEDGCRDQHHGAEEATQDFLSLRSPYKLSRPYFSRLVGESKCVKSEEPSRSS